MECRIEYYGVLSEIAGRVSEEICFERPFKTFELKKHLITLYPEFGKHTLIIFANQNRCESDTLITPGSKIDCMPPFAGG
ncbi:MAG: MoaD/ThiS family protein [Bacteroidales bacterium]|nr:MoaD/ThiS family protein [Bacteroidales bacterium]